MQKAELAMIIAPLMGHFPPSLELAKLMLQRNNQLSIIFLIMKAPFDPKGTAKIQSLVANCNFDRLHFHHLPTAPPEEIAHWNSPHRGGFITQLIEFHKIHVRETLSKINGLSGIIVDMINTTMIDIADELGVPSYIFFNPGAAFLGLLLHFQALEDELNQPINNLLSTNQTELIVPCFVKPVPISVLPVLTTREEVWKSKFLKFTRDYRRAKGIMVNTFSDLESFALNSLKTSSYHSNSGLPPIFPVGPIINRSHIPGQSTKEYSEMMNWLDSQPKGSVVFLCFGSMGSFKLDQVKEIAHGIERSGYRFIWVLRERPPAKIEFADDFGDLSLVLPDGFLDRTVSVGKVVGWVPQLAVLSHQSVGGFVYHSGWNSTLECLWYGVPMATWPLHAEQQLNAFELVKELEIAVEIKLDYFEANENQAIVKREQIEKGIRELMDCDNEVTKKVKDLSEKCRAALEEGGSSYLAMENVIERLLGNSSQISRRIKT